jgi:hypothetical protein
VSATDEVFRSKLLGPIYEENFGVTRFVLCSLAEQAMTKETEVNLWEVQNKLHVWTVEHVFPQGEAIPTSWMEMMADGDAEKAKELQNRYVHTLGNLTITRFNSTLGNRSFIDKRDRTDNKGRAIGYKNKLSLNDDLATAEKWSAAQLEARTLKLVKQTMRLFSLDPAE